MMKKDMAVTLILLAASAAVVVAVFFLTPIKDIFFGHDREAVRNAIADGRIEVTTKEDVSRYFEHLSSDEVRSLLEERDSKGEFKFLMPQFDTDTSEGPIVISEEERSIEDKDVLYLTVKGLALGSRIDSGIDGFVSGGYREDSDPPHAWISERVISEDAGTYADVLKTTYFPTIYVPGGAQALFLSKTDDTFRKTDLSSPIAPLLTDRSLPEGIFPGEAQIALVIEKGGRLVSADLDNVLLSKNGKIVMVER
jgi:hypothetical protein